MSIVFHVNPASGRTGKCEATKSCRFGSDIPHYKTAGDARKAFESANSDGTVPAAQSKAPAQKSAKVDLATAPLKVTKAKRPVWGSPCMNPKCKTTFHDIRDPTIVRKCFDAISHRLTPEEINKWKADQKAYGNNFIRKQKQEIATILDEYRRLPVSKQTKKNEADALRRALLSNSPRYYTTEAKRLNDYLRLTRVQSVNLKSDPWAGAGSGSRFEPAIPSPQPPASRSVAPSLQRVAPAEPKSVTMEDLKGYSLEKLKELEDKERDLSTTVKTREIKRMFRKPEIEEIKTLDYTKNYEVFNEFVAYLPPESQKVYSMYQSTIHNSRLNRPEVLEYLEKEFEKAKASEADQFFSELSPLDEVKELIRGKV